jgi:hypothetical protein
MEENGKLQDTSKEDNIKTNLTETKCEKICCIELTQDRAKWYDLMMNLRIL